MDTKNTKLVDLMRELAEVEAQVSLLKMAQLIKGAKAFSQEKVNGLKAQIEETAQMYGKKAQQIKEDYLTARDGKKTILELYEDAVNETQENYINFEKGELSIRSQYEVERTKHISNMASLTAENRARNNTISKLMKNPTKEKMAQIEQLNSENAIAIKQIQDEMKAVKACEEIIAETDKKIEEEKASTKADLESFLDTKDKALATLPKQNLFQKTFGAIANKINGGAKFKKAMEVISNKVDVIRNEKIPEYMNKLDIKGQEFLDAVYEKALAVDERLANVVINVLDRVDDAKDTVIEFGEGVKDRIVDAKDRAVEFGEGVKDRIVDTKDKVVEFGVNAKNKIVGAKNKLINIGKGTVRNISRAYQDKKMEVIQVLINKLEAEQQKIENLKEQSNGNNEPIIETDEFELE